MASLHRVNQPSTKERRETKHFAGKEERVWGGEGRSAAILQSKVEGQWPQQRLWGKVILLSTCIYMFLVIKEYTCTMTINSSIARPKPTWAWTKVSVLAWIYNTHIVECGNKVIIHCVCVLPTTVHVLANKIHSTRAWGYYSWTSITFGITYSSVQCTCDICFHLLLARIAVRHLLVHVW